MTVRPHDALFRSAFEDPAHAAAELRHALPPALVAEIDWATLRLAPGSFVDRKLGDRHTDLLFSATLGERPLLIYLLLEHQSTVDPRMPLRMLVYMVRIWERCLVERPAAALPVIVPVLVSHARERRRIVTRLHDLFEPLPSTVPGLAELVPDFRIVVDDIAAATDANLRSRALAAFPMLALWLLRDGRRGAAVLQRLHAWADAFRAAALAPGGIEAMHRLVRYLELVSSERRFDRIRGMLESLSSATEEAIMTYSDRVFAQGKAEGIAQGKAEGRAEAERETLLRLLAVKFGPLDDTVIARVRAADPPTVSAWLERLVAATQLDAVFGS